MPSPRWRVVVGAGIGDRVGDKVVRQIWIVCMTVKGELQNSSPRKLKLVTQRLNIRSDNAKIFDDEREATQFLAHSFEKVGSRAGYPLSGLCRWRTHGNMPRGRESAKVVQANCIHVS